MTIDLDHIDQQIIATKKNLRAALPDLNHRFQQVKDHIRHEVDAVRADQDNKGSVIPEIDYAAIADGRVNDQLVNQIKRRGAVIIRRVFERRQAEDWNAELASYISDNGYYDTEIDPKLDQYFSQLNAGRPQIFGIYWSKPQVRARQHEHLARTRAFLNSLWISRRGSEVYFDPGRECTYADRIRRREPGDDTLGLSPHMDAGSVERWLDEAYRTQVYRHVFAGDWRDYDPFDGAARTETTEIPSPAVSRVFRTFQGWTALTEQGPGDGTLQLVPIAKGIVYLLLRALQDDVPETILAGAEPCRALSITDEWHAPLLAGLCPIPTVQPGDTVWWHPDIVHAVEDKHQGSGYSNVIYIGAAPYCAKNAAYLALQKSAFLTGESAPDFAAEHYEVNYQDRATVEDLSPLGRKQMGLQDW